MGLWTISRFPHAYFVQETVGIDALPKRYNVSANIAIGLINSIDCWPFFTHLTQEAEETTAVIKLYFTCKISSTLVAVTSPPFTHCIAFKF